MLYCSRLKKALSVSAFFIFAAINDGAVVSAADCSAGQPLSWVQVDEVLDGDTLLLSDGNKVRIIGINAPEMEKPNANGQSYADEARDYVRRQIEGNAHRAGLIDGRQHSDRHGRRLAHVFLSQDRHLAAGLIAAGLGWHIVIPPNLRFATCLRKAENMARKQHRGIWENEPEAPVSQTRIRHISTGFSLVRGKITRISESRSGLWLNLGSMLTIRIVWNDVRYFTEWEPKQLVGLIVEARGWVYERNHQKYLRVRHPQMLQILR